MQNVKCSYPNINLLQLDCEKAYNKLGWKSIIDTEDLVNLTINWYKSFYNKNDVWLYRQIIFFLVKPTYIFGFK